MPAARTCLITGASRGIGRALVDVFLDGGHAVIAVARAQEALRALEDEHAGRPLTTLSCDVTDEKAVAACATQAGPVDVLVNNAGMARSAALAKTSLADWNAHLAVNATGAFLWTRALVPGMLERGWGRVVTVASTAAVAGAPYTAAYAASKHAAVGLMRTVAAELAGRGVTANAVCPTFVDTPMTQQSIERIVERTGRTHAQAEQALTAASPIGRLLAPEEVAAAVAWLASESAGAVNGQALVIDGGGIQR